MAAKTQKTNLVNEDKIVEAFIDFVLTEQKHPASIYAFAKQLSINESEFYKYFSSFDAIEEHIWKTVASRTISTLTASDEFDSYTTKEKVLGLFYTLVEVLNQSRSYYIYSLGQSKIPLKAAESMKSIVYDFTKQIINEGIAENQIEDRKLLTERYPDVIWLNVNFVIGYWMKDNSKSFEKTDALIEKTVNLLMELLAKSAIDNIVDLWKFLLQDKLKGAFKM